MMTSNVEADRQSLRRRKGRDFELRTRVGDRPGSTCMRSSDVAYLSPNNSPEMAATIQRLSAEPDVAA